jgi:PhoPQ-activated pathogenicity-related protein
MKLIRMKGHVAVKLLKTCAAMAALMLAVAPRSIYADMTVLEEYVKSSDSSFRYSLVKTSYNFLYTTYVFDLTSQQWHPDEVDPGVWEHWLTIVEPRLLGRYTEHLPLFSLVETDKALLRIIKGDEEHEDRPSGASSLVVQLALQNNSIAAEIEGIPVGPLAFQDEQDEIDWWECIASGFDEDECKVLRSEDSLQARSLDLALSTGDFTWASMAPMVKAVIRGMDLIQEFLKERNRDGAVVDEFVLTGHSKRGWTAWLTAAMDDRVAGIAPLGYDLLNLTKQAELQEDSWDDQSPELEIYEEFDIYERFKTAMGKELINNIDPYAYVHRLDMPTLILVGTNDNYSNADSINLYLDNLPGEVSIFYDPNMGHDIRATSGAQSAIASFYRHIVQGTSMPQLIWDISTDGSFEVTTVVQAPRSARLWTAINPAARDFRETSGVKWESSTITADESDTFKGSVSPSAESGYTAFFIELTFKDGKDQDPAYNLSTPITVLGE